MDVDAIESGAGTSLAPKTERGEKAIAAKFSKRSTARRCYAVVVAINSLTAIPVGQELYHHAGIYM